MNLGLSLFISLTWILSVSHTGEGRKSLVSKICRLMPHLSYCKSETESPTQLIGNILPTNPNPIPTLPRRRPILRRRPLLIRRPISTNSLQPENTFHELLPVLTERKVVERQLFQEEEEEPTLTIQEQEYCNKFGEHFQYFCQNRARALQPNVRDFCPTYAETCLGITREPAEVKVQQAASDEELARKCAQHRENAEKYCFNSAIKLPPHIVQLCNLYKEKCTSQPQPRPQLRPQPTPQFKPQPRPQLRPPPITRVTSRNSAFQPLPPTTLIDAPSDPANELIKQQCDKFRQLGTTFCLREVPERFEANCTMFRKYCSNTLEEPDDLRTVAGLFSSAVGGVDGSFNIPGIPFYPFNPAGAVGGGKKWGADFGSWGGGGRLSNGVSDFWTEDVEAGGNWYTGYYGGKRSYGVPLFSALKGTSETEVSVPINGENFGGPIAVGTTDSFGDFFQTGDSIGVDWLNGGVSNKNGWSLPFLGLGVNTGNSITFPSVGSFLGGLPIFDNEKKKQKDVFN